jgi:hypothetical protein
MILLFSAYWPGSVYFVCLELVLLEICTEIFCDIFWQTHIWNRVALNTCCSVVHLTQAMLYNTEWLIQKCINRSRQIRWFIADVCYHWLLLLQRHGRLGLGWPLNVAAALWPNRKKSTLYLFLFQYQFTHPHLRLVLLWCVATSNSNLAGDSSGDESHLMTWTVFFHTG